MTKYRFNSLFYWLLNKNMIKANSENANLFKEKAELSESHKMLSKQTSI